MNKPSSIIISSSAPSLPRYPPPQPHPYFCLFIRMTSRGRGGVGWEGRRGGCCVSTVWQHGPGEPPARGLLPVCWGHGRVCVCARAWESTLILSICVTCAVVWVCKHICICVRTCGCVFVLSRCERVSVSAGLSACVGVCLCDYGARVSLVAEGDSVSLMSG